MYSNNVSFKVNIGMRAKVIVLVSILLLPGCQVSLMDAFSSRGATPPPQLTVAEQFVGMHERTDRVTLKEFMGIDPVRVEWCAAFVNSVLTEVGLESTRSLMARSYLNWGKSTDTPSPGDVMVFSRGTQGWQGHVGFYVATIDYKGDRYWVVLGGNQDNSVSYSLFKENHWRHLDTRTVLTDPEKELLFKQQWMMGGIPLELIE